MSAPGEEPDRSSRLRPGRMYSGFVGAAFVALIALAALNAVQTDENGLLGGREDRGMVLAQFAVPDARGPVRGDANVFQDDCASAELPCPPADRRTPACRVSGAGIIRVCDFFDRPLVISFWFTRGADCLPTQDALEEVASRYRGRVGFLSINIRDERDDVRRIIDQRGWRLPVGHDADGAVSNVYRVGVCPTVAFAYPGGILSRALVGSEELDAGSLRRELDRLLRESRRRATVER